MNIVNYKKIILIIIVVLLTFFGYWYMFISKKDTSVDKTIKSSVSTVNTTQYDKEFVSILASLDPVNLDVSFFETEAYKALNYPDIPFVINYPKDSGRINPFLPIGTNISPTNNNVQTQSKTNVGVETPAQLTTVSTTTATTTIIKTPPKPTPKTF